MENYFSVKKKTGKTWFIDLDGTIFEHNSYLKGKYTFKKCKNF